MASIEPDDGDFKAFLGSLPAREASLKAKIAVADYAAVMCRNHQRSPEDWLYLEKLLQVAYGECENTEVK